jgi:hypothetical protein
MSQDNATVIKNAVDAYNKGNAEGVSNHFASALQAGISGSVQKDVQYTINHIKADGPHVLFAYTAKGKSAEWNGSGVATVENGKIVALHHIEDVISKVIQMGGALPSLTGNWAGSSSGINVTLNLTQTGNNVTGTASAFGSTFPVTGTVNYPNVVLNGSLNGLAVNFTGAYNPPPNAIPGTLTITGFPPPLTVTLNRQ